MYIILRLTVALKSDALAANKSLKMLVASDVLYLITLFLAKWSVVAMFLRLTPHKSHNRASWATLAVCVMWLISSIVIITIGCEANKPWAPAAEQCKNLVCDSPPI
jgi:hypothetical protein